MSMHDPLNYNLRVSVKLIKLLKWNCGGNMYKKHIYHNHLKWHTVNLLIRKKRAKLLSCVCTSSTEHEDRTPKYFRLKHETLTVISQDKDN